jgi:hypothetical protein
MPSTPTDLADDSFREFQASSSTSLASSPAYACRRRPRTAASFHPPRLSCSNEGARLTTTSLRTSLAPSSLVLPSSIALRGRRDELDEPSGAEEGEGEEDDGKRGGDS